MDVAAFKSRVKHVQQELVGRGLGGMVVIKPENVRYLCGVWGYSSRTEYAMPRRLIACIIPSRGEVTLIVPKIELNYARRQTWIADVRQHVEWVSQSQEVFGGLNLLDIVLEEKGITHGRVGIETGFVSARLLGLIQAQFPHATFEDSATVVEELRMIKSPEEIAIMRIGGRMAVTEYQVELQAIHAGVTEYEVALKGREEATRLSAQYLAEHGRNTEIPLDHPIVEGLQIITSGPRLDMVHALASNRRISDGDVVLLDFCRIPQLDYYRIGFARNAALRSLTGEEAGIYETVARSYRRALEVLRPGVPAEEPDLVARAILDEAGLGETFVHRTGRGVGLEGVERPEIGAGDKTPLRAGMVVTIEPSVYFQGFAVHVEDTFLITEHGHECLTECPREVKVLATAKH